MKYAIAILNIKPSEFWELTLAEFNVAMDAFLWKEDRELRNLAQQAQWMLIPYGKEPIPVSTLMGDEKPEEEKQVTTQADLDDMMQLMGKGGD
jgi:hypothetical protein